MIERFTQGKLTWINIKKPTIEEIQQVMHELDITPVLMSDLTTPVPKNSAFRAGSAIKITLDFPVIKRIDASHPYEMKFVISKQSLLTIQYEEMDGIDRFKRQFEIASTIRKTQKHLTGAHLFITLINHLYESASTKLDHVEAKLVDIEDSIFDHNERAMVIEISSVSKKLITFRHIIRGHEDIFRIARPFFEIIYGDMFNDALQDIQVQYFMLQRRTNTLFETLTALRETHTAMLTTHQNEVIKNLTIMAFITFPLTLLSSMFGMNVESAPIIGKEGDFWVIIGIMSFAAFGFFMFFKHKRWL